MNPSAERFIIHFNVADFAAAVEQLIDPGLAHRPVVVAPQGAARAVVYDMSEAAFRCGVRKQMPLRQAQRRCPEAVVLAPHTARYEQAMAAFFRYAAAYSPLVEMTDVKGHLFVDVTGTGRLFGPAEDVAWRVRREVRARMGLDPIWSVAPSKLMAKVATRVVKPTGESIVQAGEEAEFLSPLSLSLIPGIEGEDVTRFRELNIFTAGQAAALTGEQLAVLFGRRGQYIRDSVTGIDFSPVAVAGAAPARILLDHEFGNDTSDRHLVDAALYRLVEHAGARLRRQRLVACRAGVYIEYGDGARVVRQAAVSPGTGNDGLLFDAACTALNRGWTRRVRIRHVRIVFDRLTFPPGQLELFPELDACKARTGHLMGAIDAVRGRFGASALHMGRSLAAAP
jgi:DNA polymerase-4